MSIADEAVSQKISDRAVLSGVKTEFDRTLPFWRCFTDLQDRHGHKPVVMERDVELGCRLPCTAFKGVDVVWAITTVTINVQTSQLRRSTAPADVPSASDSVSAPSATPPVAPGHKRSSRGMSREEKASFAAYVEQKQKLSRYWRDVPHESHTYTIGTIHFVHDDAHVRGSVGASRSFHIQSVFFYEEPAILQCVAGTMVVFAFLVYSSMAVLATGRNLVEKATTDGATVSVVRTERHWALTAFTGLGFSEDAPVSEERLQLTERSESVYELHRGRATPQLAHAAEVLLPPADSRVLILGMGGNSMACALRVLLGASAELHIVEMEPAVVQTCVNAGTLHRDEAHTTVYEQSAQEALPQLANASFDMVFMDLFEPVKGGMETEASLVSQAASKLKGGGLLIVNDHQLPSAKGLAPLVTRFGSGNVQAVNLHGWNESVIVCVQPGDPLKDGLVNATTRWTMNLVSTIYEQLVPAWLPPPSWLQKSHTVGPPDARARIWTS